MGPCSARGFSQDELLRKIKNKIEFLCCPTKAFEEDFMHHRTLNYGNCDFNHYNAYECLRINVVRRHFHHSDDSKILKFTLRFALIEFLFLKIIIERPRLYFRVHHARFSLGCVQILSQELQFWLKPYPRDF